MRIICDHTSNNSTYTFALKNKSDGSAIDLTGKTVTFIVFGRNSTTGERYEVAEFACTVTSPTTGTGSFTLSGNGIEKIGEHDGYIRVDGGAGDKIDYPKCGSITVKITGL